MYQLTIVVPVYNEEENLDQFHRVMESYLQQTPIASTILFVNDGSTDGSRGKIRRICRRGGHYDDVNLDRNYGLSTAIKAGIDLCTTPLLGYIDADLQTTPEDFLDYFAYLDAFDMVNGIRRQRADSLGKKLSSRIANAFRRALIKDGIQDTCCPLKIMRASMAKQMPFFKGMHRFMPALIQLQGGRVKQVPVRHFPRYACTSKYHLGNRLLGPFVDTLVFVWMKKRYIHYQVTT